jgi:hypothetical protein
MTLLMTLTCTWTLDTITTITFAQEESLQSLTYTDVVLVYSVSTYGTVKGFVALELSPLKEFSAFMTLTCTWTLLHTITTNSVCPSQLYS